MSKIQQTVCTSVADRRFVEQFEFQVDMLVGLVLEIAKENQVLLLSPVMRQMLVYKAAQVRSLLGPLHGRMAVDNPGADLQPWKEQT